MSTVSADVFRLGEHRSYCILFFYTDKKRGKKKYDRQDERQRQQRSRRCQLFPPTSFVLENIVHTAFYFFTRTKKGEKRSMIAKTSDNDNNDRGDVNCFRRRLSSWRTSFILHFIFLHGQKKGKKE